MRLDDLMDTILRSAPTDWHAFMGTQRIGTICLALSKANTTGSRLNLTTP